MSGPRWSQGWRPKGAPLPRRNPVLHGFAALLAIAAVASGVLAKSLIEDGSGYDRLLGLFALLGALGLGVACIMVLSNSSNRVIAITAQLILIILLIALVVIR